LHDLWIAFERDMRLRLFFMPDADILSLIMKVLARHAGYLGALVQCPMCCSGNISLFFAVRQKFASA
jgi:hypothetical protein